MSWPQVLLGDVSELVYGKALRGYTEEHDDEHTARVFGTNGPIGWAKEPLIEQPTVIVGRKGAYRGIHFSDIPSWTIDTAFYTKVDPERVDVKWFYYRLLLVDINGMNSGAAIPSTRREDFYSLKLPIPDLKSQRRMASVLSTYDDLIEINRRRIALLEEAAWLLYREWFVHFRFPGHEHVKITDGLPEGWERLPASEAFEVNPKTPRSDDGIIRYIPMAALSETGMVIDRGPAEKRDKSTSVRFRNGDTLLARITPCLENGKTSYVQFLAEDEVACGSTEFIVLRGRRVSNYFVYLTARQHDFRENAIRSMIGSSGRQRVQPSCFDRYLVPIPPQVLSTLFDEAVGDMFAQIGNLDQQNQKLDQARDLLLPRLMNGEIAV